MDNAMVLLSLNFLVRASDGEAGRKTHQRAGTKYLGSINLDLDIEIVDYGGPECARLGTQVAFQIGTITKLISSLRLER